MSGISSKAAGKLENKKSKYNGYELNTDFDLNLYESFYRFHDSQIGRFLQIDPKPNESVSLYAAMDNNPIRFADPLGDTLVINLFNPTSDGSVFHNVANTAVSNQVNDGTFIVFGHSNSSAIQYTDKDGIKQLAQTPEQFNTVMSERSPEYKQDLKDGTAVTLKLYGCNTAAKEYVVPDGRVIKKETTIAEKISVSLPNKSVVIAADGYVWYGKTEGKSAIRGVQQTTEAQPENTYKGGFVTIKNGKTVAKEIMTYNRATKVTKMGENKKIIE